VVIKAPNNQQMASLSIPAVDKTVKIRKIINIRNRREDELTSDDDSASSSDNESTEQSAVDKGRPIKIKRLL